MRRFHVISRRQSERTERRAGSSTWRYTGKAARPAALQPKEMPAGYNVEIFEGLAVYPIACHHYG